jgi:hypothetical protein
MGNYIKPILFTDIDKQDLYLVGLHSIRYRREIAFFKLSAELLISLFSNSQRIKQEGDVDCIQLLTVKTFQDLRASLNLALRGMYAQSITLTRGMLESSFLIYDFKLNPSNEDVWFNGSKTKREKMFKPSKVRERVTKSGGANVKTNSDLYGLLSTWAIHSGHESHIWYVELKKKKVLYHWAGRQDFNISDMIITSVLSAIANTIFVLVEEGLYAFKEDWFDDYLKWKKSFLELSRSFKTGGIKGAQMKVPKVIFIP